jgi:hypothetical protein
MAAVLAEQLALEGHAVTYVTTAGLVGFWSRFTMEQARSQARLIEVGVRIVVSHAVEAVRDSQATLSCVFSGQPQALPCGTFVPVTSREPNDALWHDLQSDPEANSAAGIASIQRIGDCKAPGLIAHAVYDGHRTARRIDGDLATPEICRKNRRSAAIGLSYPLCYDRWMASSDPLTVDLALVLAVDCSTSIDAGDFACRWTASPRLCVTQPSPRQSLAASIGRSRSRSCSGPTGGPSTLCCLGPLLAGGVSLEIAAQRIAVIERRSQPGGTGLAAGIDYAALMLEALPFNADRRSIDVSGDGQDNEGGSAAASRDQAVLRASPSTVCRSCMDRRRWRAITAAR